MEKIGLALDWFPNADHVPVLSGMNEGFFYNEDMELHVMSPVNHEAGIELASVGKLDFALTDPIHIPSARAKGHHGLIISSCLRLVEGLEAGTLPAFGNAPESGGLPCSFVLVSELYTPVFGLLLVFSSLYHLAANLKKQI